MGWLDKSQWDLVLKVGGLAVMAGAIVFLLIWSGTVPCKKIPYSCDAYDQIMGGPRVLIVHGDSGLGDPQLLKTYIRDPHYVGALAVDVQSVDTISLGNLKKYQLVIVEQARKLSADQLQMFEDYVIQNGGRLVWVGDSGVEKAEGDLPGLIDQNTGRIVYNNPWIRVRESTDLENYDVINFDEFLGLRYTDNYCNQATCSDGDFNVGMLIPESTGTHPLIYGISPVLGLQINKERQFALVKQIPNSPSLNIVLTLDLGGNQKGKDGNYIGRTVPLITTSTIGAPGAERVAYYAYPPEWFAQDNSYFLFLKNMYYGMLGR